MGFIVDAVGGLFDSDQQRQGEKHILNDYRAAEAGAINAANEARGGTYSLYEPWQTRGYQGFTNALAMQTPGFQYSPNDPSYNWRFNEGMRAVQGSAAARGALNSGGTLKALNRFGQGLASTEFNNDFSRNNILAGYGERATNGLADAHKDWANLTANALFKGAEGRTSAYRGKADADSGTAGSLTGLVKGAGSFFGLF